MSTRLTLRNLGGGWAQAAALLALEALFLTWTFVVFAAAQDASWIWGNEQSGAERRSYWLGAALFGGALPVVCVLYGWRRGRQAVVLAGVVGLLILLVGAVAYPPPKGSEEPSSPQDPVTGMTRTVPRDIWQVTGDTVRAGGEGALIIGTDQKTSQVVLLRFASPFEPPQCVDPIWLQLALPITAAGSPDLDVRLSGLPELPDSIDRQNVDHSSLAVPGMSAAVRVDSLVDTASGQHVVRYDIKPLYDAWAGYKFGHTRSPRVDTVGLQLVLLAKPSARSTVRIAGNDTDAGPPVLLWRKTPGGQC